MTVSNNCGPDDKDQPDGVVEGTAGNDIIDVAYTGDPEGDRIDNNDAILPGEAPNDDIVDAGAGNDRIYAGKGDDTVYAGSGDDYVEGGAGDDVIYGDSNLHHKDADSFAKWPQDISNVVFYYDRDGDGVIDYSVKVDGFPSSGSSKFIGNDLDKYYNQLNSFILESDPNLDATTTVIGVSIKGGTQPTRFYAVEGNTNGPAPDAGPTMNTGPGNDRVLQYGDFYKTYDPANDGVIDNGAPGNDTLHGGDGDDTIYGEDGDDKLFGEDGNDRLYGGNGSDYVDGGAGDDYIDTSGDKGLPDRGFPSYNGFPAVPADGNIYNDRDIVYGGAGNDTILTGDDKDYIDGGSGNDTIDGGLDDDTILGGSGNDYIIGGEGSDVIDGGDGDDTIYGGLGPDLPDAFNIRDDGSDGPADPVTDNGRDVIHGGAGNDHIYGQDDDDVLYGDEGDDYIDGGIDDDRIFGGSGNDTLLGGQGDDLIDGGEGADWMEGGDDRDTFVNVNAGDTVHGGAGYSLSYDDDFDTLDLTGSAGDGAFKLHITGPDSDGNGVDGYVDYFDKDGNATGTLTFTNIERIVPCFTPGTLIATPRGEQAVETLKVGDRIITRDNGIQRIRWIGQRSLSGAELSRNSHLQPVRIRKGALGGGLPERDMLVSPNHRVLVASDKTALYFEESEVLVAAKHLTGLSGVDVIEAREVTYIHFMFDQHEVVLSDGAWTESFQPGDQSLMGLGNAQRNEIYELFPDLKTRSGLAAYQSARRSLKRHEAQLLVH